MKKSDDLTRLAGATAAERTSRLRAEAAVRRGPAESAPGDEDRAAGPDVPESGLLTDIRLEVRVELGRARMPLRDALRLVSGSVVDLERLVDEPVELYVSDLLIARGEIVVVNDNFCVRITEVTPAAPEDSP